MASYKSCFTCLVVAASLVTLTGLGFLYSGLYPMGADRQHHDLTYWALETLRERSIARAASNIEVPTDLNSPERLLAGGPDYNEMCSGCHLRPDETESDFSIGLYPSPPNLAVRADASGNDYGKPLGANNASLRRQFWIIKHGIKASGMPAWGPGHDDQRIWNMVAFLQRLPDLSPSQYQILTAGGRHDGGSH